MNKSKNKEFKKKETSNEDEDEEKDDYVEEKKTSIKPKGKNSLKGYNIPPDEE